MADDTNVIGFRKAEPEEKPNPEEVVYHCACGCQSWYIRADMMLECTACGNIGSFNDGEWSLQMPSYDPDKVTPSKDGQVTVNAYGDHEFARRRVMSELNKMLDKGTLCMVAGYDVNGYGRSWFGAFTPEQRDWCQEKMEALVEFLKKTEYGQGSGMRTLPMVQMSDTPQGNPEQGEFDYGCSTETQDQ